MSFDFGGRRAMQGSSRMISSMRQQKLLCKTWPLQMSATSPCARQLWRRRLQVTTWLKLPLSGTSLRLDGISTPSCPALHVMCSGYRLFLGLRSLCSLSSSVAIMSRGPTCATLGILSLVPAAGVLHLPTTELIAFSTAPGLNIFDSNFRLRFTVTPSRTLLGLGSFWLRGALRYLLQFLRAVQRAAVPSSSESEHSEEEGWELGSGVWFFPRRCGLGCGVDVLSFGWAMWVLGRAPLFLFFGFFFPWVLGFLFPLFFPLFHSWGSRSARPWGWLDGVSFFSFSSTLHFTVGHTGLCTFRVWWASTLPQGRTKVPDFMIVCKCMVCN